MSEHVVEILSERHPILHLQTVDQGRGELEERHLQGIICISVEPLVPLPPLFTIDILHNHAPGVMVHRRIVGVGVVGRLRDEGRCRVALGQNVELVRCNPNVPGCVSQANGEQVR